LYRDHNQREFARALRNAPTDPEKRLWHFLRAQKLRGHKFRRQAAIGAYVVDFVCFTHKLIVELDGPQHLDPEAVEHDNRRTAWLATRGFQVIRFRNQELDENIRAVVDKIERTLIDLKTHTPNPPPQPSPPRGGSRTKTNQVVLPEGTEPILNIFPVPSPLRGGLGRGSPANPLDTPTGLNHSLLLLPAPSPSTGTGPNEHGRPKVVLTPARTCANSDGQSACDQHAETRLRHRRP
jgi:very-short-patch-repair endonuclease